MEKNLCCSSVILSLYNTEYHVNISHISTPFSHTLTFTVWI